MVFVDSGSIHITSHGIDEAQAAALRSALATFTDWDSPEMDIYDNYDAAKASISPAGTGDPILGLGKQPVVIDVDDASVEHDKYPYQS